MDRPKREGAKPLFERSIDFWKIAAIRSRGQLDGGGQVGEAGFGFALEEQVRAFLQGARRPGRYGKFGNGDDCVARRRSCGRKEIALELRAMRVQRQQERAIRALQASSNTVQREEPPLVLFCRQ
jgi:hypothetical protein